MNGKRSLCFSGVVLVVSIFFNQAVAATAKPDLVIDQVQVGTPPGLIWFVDSGQEKFSVIWKIANQGNADAKAFLVNILQSPRWGFDLASQRKASFLIDALVAGESRVETQTIQAGIKPGVAYLGLQVDVANQVAEFNERNNHSSSHAQGKIAIVVNGNIRSADFCGRLESPSWGIVTPELQNGRGRYVLTPAEYIVFASLENLLTDRTGKKVPVNPLWLLVTLENEQRLISQGKEAFADLEEAVAKATGYGVKLENAANWRGFGAQVVASTWQLTHYFDVHQYTMQESFNTYTGAQGSWATFQLLYAKYAKLLNQRLRSKFRVVPDSDGYYMDFGRIAKSRTEEFINAVQWLLEREQSVLAGKKLFSQVAVSSTFIPGYSNTDDLCTVLPVSAAEAVSLPEHDWSSEH